MSTGLAARLDPDRLGAILSRGHAPVAGADRAADRAERQAAVLVGLTEHPAGVVLTRRAASLRQHAGQVAFPGGRIDPTDRDAEAAALREAEEEIGLCPADVRLLGRLPGIVTGTGYHVTPVVGLIGGRPAFRPSPEEVDCVFVLPMHTLRDPAAPVRRERRLNGSWRSFWVWPHEEQFIWGATAAILVELAAALTDAG